MCLCCLLSQFPKTRSGQKRSGSWVQATVKSRLTLFHVASNLKQHTDQQIYIHRNTVQLGNLHMNDSLYTYKNYDIPRIQILKERNTDINTLRQCPQKISLQKLFRFCVKYCRKFYQSLKKSVSSKISLVPVNVTDLRSLCGYYSRFRNYSNVVFG